MEADVNDYSPPKTSISANLSSSFVCERISNRPLMTFMACAERKKQCGEKDEQGIRNNLSECRGCSRVTKSAAPTPFQTKSRSTDYARQYPCPCCGHDIDTTYLHPIFGNKMICHSCLLGLRTATNAGLNDQEAVEFTWFFRSNARKYNHFNWESRLSIYKNRTAKGDDPMPQGKVKRGTCDWCGRPDMAFVNRYAGKYYTCGSCRKRILRLLSEGLDIEDIYEKHRAVIAESVIMNAQHVQPTNASQKRDSDPAMLPESQDDQDCRVDYVGNCLSFHVDIPILNDRDADVIRWIYSSSVKMRRSMEQQILAILECVMKRETQILKEAGNDV